MATIRKKKSEMLSDVSTIHKYNFEVSVHYLSIPMLYGMSYLLHFRGVILYFYSTLFGGYSY